MSGEVSEGDVKIAERNYCTVESSKETVIRVVILERMPDAFFTSERRNSRVFCDTFMLVSADCHDQHAKFRTSDT